MKSTLFLLAAIFSNVDGVDIGAKIRGVTSMGESCSEADEMVLYKECVEDVAVSMGVDLSRKLELRGNRELQSTGNKCGVCCDPQNCPDCNCYPRGTWCFTYCSTGRRLTVADEESHTERFLLALGLIQQAANDCFDNHIPEYPCLGDPKDLTVKLYFSE
jgi:hypothetical protein